VTPSHLDAVNAQCLFNLAHSKYEMYFIDNNLQKNLAEGMDFALRRSAGKIFWDAVLNEAKNFVSKEISWSRDSSSPLASHNHELAGLFR